MKILKRVVANVVCVFLLMFLFSSILAMELIDHYNFMSQREMEALEMQTLVQMYIVPETLTPYWAEIGFINNTYHRFAGRSVGIYVKSGNGWRSLWISYPPRQRSGPSGIHYGTPTHERDYEWLNPEVKTRTNWFSPREIQAHNFIDFDYHFNGLPPGEYRLIKDLTMIDEMWGHAQRFPHGPLPRLRVVAAFTIP